MTIIIGVMLTLLYLRISQCKFSISSSLTHIDERYSSWWNPKSAASTFIHNRWCPEQCSLLYHYSIHTEL